MTNEEMSLKTKHSLAEALKNIMRTKKLSKITVSELITACNINRKTFYYHFQDIYDLLKWMLEQEAIEVVKNFDLIVNTEDAIRFVMEYAEKNDYIINGAFDTMGYEQIKRFFHNDFLSVVYESIQRWEKELDVHLDTKFKNFMVEFYTEASAGLLIEWVKNRKVLDKESALQNLLFIYKVTIPAILKAKKNSIEN